MPVKIKSKLLIITVLCATLTVLFVIAPYTAAVYAVVLLAVSMFLSVMAWTNAKGQVELQYKISDFMTLMLMVFISLAASLANVYGGGSMQYIMAAACGLVTVRSITLLFAREDK